MKKIMDECVTVKIILFVFGLLMEITPTTYSHTVSFPRPSRLFNFFNFSSKATENLTVSVLLINSSSSYIETINLPLQDATTQLNLQMDFQKEIVFIIHGYMSSGRVQWMSDLALAYMQQKDVNVFLVDWGSGAITFNYATAAKNTEVTASFLSDFINNLITIEGVNASSIHIIGHSLGAHIAGFIGNAIPKIGRITGLDPARPLFTNPEKRLKRGDAIFVDVIHTNAFFFGCGIADSIGDVDFFLNGGRLQPGCPFYLMNTSYYFNPFSIGNVRMDGTRIMLTTSFIISIEYFIETVKYPDCAFIGYRDMEQEPITDNMINDDNSIMGLSTFEYPARGDFHIRTNSEPPYCIGIE